MVWLDILSELARVCQKRKVVFRVHLALNAACGDQSRRRDKRRCSPIHKNTNNTATITKSVYSFFRRKIEVCSQKLRFVRYFKESSKEEMFLKTGVVKSYCWHKMELCFEALLVCSVICVCSVQHRQYSFRWVLARDSSAGRQSVPPESLASGLLAARRLEVAHVLCRHKGTSGSRRKSAPSCNIEGRRCNRKEKAQF